MTIGFTSPLRRSEPMEELAITARSRNLGGVPTREEIAAVCAALGRQPALRVADIERDERLEITRFRQHDELLALVGRVQLRWTQARRDAYFTVTISVPTRLMEQAYGIARRHGLGRPKAREALGRELWKAMYEDDARKLLLRELVREELRTPG